jgi:hypothetical protein
VGISKSLSAIRKRKLRKPKKTLAETMGALGVIGGVIFFFLCVTYVVGAYWIVGILAEISQKDYTPANQRIAAYEKFFRGLEKKGMEIEKSTPYIKEGAKYFLWTVTIPSQSDRLIYRWEHDLETNKVSPLTSPATYLDIELGYVKSEDASDYPYEPGDPIALQMAQGEYEPLETYAMPEQPDLTLQAPAGAVPPEKQPMPYEKADTGSGGEEGGGGDEAAPPADENGGDETKPGDGEKPKDDGGGGEAKPGEGDKGKDDGGGEAKPKDGEGGENPPDKEKPKDDGEKPKDEGGKAKGEGDKDDSVPVK